MDPLDVPRCWARLLDGLAVPEQHFGPECRALRPRAHDTYSHLVAVLGVAGACAEAIGLAYTQRPAPTTRVFALGLYREHQGHGLGPRARDAIVEHCFADPAVIKVESETYSVNTQSLGALHTRHPRLTPEGRQRATVVIAGVAIDRYLYGITREEWTAATSPEEETPCATY